ncbi:MAG TPA: hypothetical protein VIV55_05100 [Flavobacterium sp.]
MIKKYLKYLKTVSIDILIYRMTEANLSALSDVEFDIQKESLPKSKKRYFITENGVVVHNSFLFEKVHVLKLLQKNGPVIGDCYTNPNYRGKSIYPFVINYIAKELIEQNKIREVFIIVNSDNVNSIRGIGKAGFEYYASIKAKRWLFFYFDKKIDKVEQN